MGSEGRENLFGHGLINAEKALNAAVFLRDNPDQLIVPDLRFSFSYLALTSISKFTQLVISNASLGESGASEIPCKPRSEDEDSADDEEEEVKPKVISIVSDQDWLTVAPALSDTLDEDGERLKETDCEGFGLYDVRADTSGLLDDYYEAKIVIDVGGGLIKEIDVSLTLIPVSGQQIESPFYIHMYLDESNVGVYPWTEIMVPATNVGSGVWFY